MYTVDLSLRKRKCWCLPHMPCCDALGDSLHLATTCVRVGLQTPVSALAACEQALERIIPYASKSLHVEAKLATGVHQVRKRCAMALTAASCLARTQRWRACLHILVRQLGASHRHHLNWHRGRGLRHHICVRTALDDIPRSAPHA